MSWPEAIFYSVLVICGLLVFFVLLAIVLVARAFAPPPTPHVDPPLPFSYLSYRSEPVKPQRWEYEKRTKTTTTPRTSVQPETDIDPTKMPGKSAKPETEFRNPYDGVDFTDAAKKAMERDERYRKAKEGTA